MTDGVLARASRSPSKTPTLVEADPGLMTRMRCLLGHQPSFTPGSDAGRYRRA